MAVHAPHPRVEVIDEGGTVTLSEEERQMILMGLGWVAVNRVGFNWFTRQIAEKLKGREMFERFKQLEQMDEGLTPVMCAKHKRNIRFCQCPLP